MMKTLLFYIYSIWCLTSPSTLQVSAQSECFPCADGLEPFLIGTVCEKGVELATTLTDDQEECKVLQLALYQGDCCDSPPEGYCTLCENGSQNYNSDKVIPPNAGDPAQVVVTCQNYELQDKYLSEGATGICSDTERFRARAWCECDGMQPACTLTCDDGNPPPDVTKTDQIYGETCERFAYEYTTLTADECADPVFFLNFDAKAFCCNEPAPENCSICPSGKKLKSPDTVVETEFYGTTTCGEIEAYASYLYLGACSLFLAELLDNPTDADSECCEPDPDAPTGSSEGSSVATTFSLLVTPVLWNFLEF